MLGSQAHYPTPLQVGQQTALNATRHTVCQLTSVGREVARLIVQNLRNGEHARSLRKVRPEVLPDMLDGINPDPIYAILAHKVLDPRIHRLHDLVIFGVQVREGQLRVPKPALLDVSLVVVVRDEAFRMEFRLVGEGCEAREVGRVRGGNKVVDDDVDHEVHSARVQRRAQCLEIVGRSEMRVEGVDVFRPVAAHRRSVWTALI